MRKYGLGFMIFGGALGAVLFAVRCGEWYRSASLQNYSEPAQLVEAAFRACIVTLLLGLVFFLLSLRKPKTQEEPAEEEEYEYDGEPYEAPVEEAFSPTYTQPFDFDAFDTVPQPGCDPEPTRRIGPEDGWTCAICGCVNPGFSAVCAVCGAQRGSTLQ